MTSSLRGSSIGGNGGGGKEQLIVLHPGMVNG
jgi:hypothetical protein